ncbi:MAG: hypothetical protein P8164_02825 [Gammaproteobacteria bacterium]
MMVLKLPRDDLGLLRLEQANLSKATASVSSLTTTTTGIVPQSSPIRSAPTSIPEERRRDCRGQNRQSVVLPDTRSHYERRTHERRHDSADQETQHLPLGIAIHI